MERREIIMVKEINDIEKESSIIKELDEFKVKMAKQKKEDSEFWVELGLMTIYISHLRSFPYAITRQNIEHDLIGWEQKRNEFIDDYGEKHFLPRCTGYSKSECVLDGIITHCEELKKNL